MCAIKSSTPAVLTSHLKTALNSLMSAVFFPVLMCFLLKLDIWVRHIECFMPFKKGSSVMVISIICYKLVRGRWYSRAGHSNSREHLIG